VEIKSIVGDGMYTFAIVADADADVRRLCRLRRSTGAVQVFAGEQSGTGSHWLRSSFVTAEKVRGAITATGAAR
jgi:hypothetical protein